MGILSTKLGGGTTRMSGTSMAAPHVAGVVALLCQAYPGLLPEEARARIMSGAQGVGALPVDSPTVGNTPDGDYEGILYAPGALAAP